MEISAVAKVLLAAGAVLIVAGGMLFLAGKAGIPLGKLPGDINLRRENVSFHFPIVTCIVISIALTIALNLISRFWK